MSRKHLAGELSSRESARRGSVSRGTVQSGHCPIIGKYVSLPSQHLLVKKEQRKHQENLWNLSKFNNKDTRTMLYEKRGSSFLLTLSRLYTLLW